MAAFILKSFEFRREREATWTELEVLVGRVERQGIASLTEEQLRRLPLLYRGALSSLSVARAISLDKNLLTYLEGLVARAYVCVYSPRRRFFGEALAFFSRRFPALVVGMRRALLVTTVLMLAGTGVGLALTLFDPERYYSFVEPAMAGGRGPTSSREELAEILRHGSDGEGQLTAFASFLFTHNAKIGLSCFALGFLGGVPVLLLVFVNGLTLGAMLAIHVQKGLGLDFVAWVLPHGVTELFAVCLCGAAGLSVGQALIFPGRLRRLDSLARRGREAGAVVVGAVLLFFIAALLEGYFRQIVHHIPARLAVALVTALLWIGYFLRFGKQRGAG
ncbi:stage II sporulation protein M [Chondromyces apiculatus]|uniref:Stage II sporulation protein M n=1 Tax=Chondromyces apiculatus DSM 436 TaxID=1192034 RepID=A0A017TCF3_9BACT|nr:stage II sporulation protein M [Chondromyces apiculatus]EYF06934.1 Hypothetical protein CAP_1192 [Chondromyces apiculatus DSM 436]